VDIKKLKDFIRDEKAYRDAESAEIREMLEKHGLYLKRSEKELENYYLAIAQAKEEISEKVKILEKTKDDLLNYSLQIIAIVVAILAVIMSLAFLSTDYYQSPQKFEWFLRGAIIYFCVIFTLWIVVGWIIKIIQWYKKSRTS